MARQTLCAISVGLTTLATTAFGQDVPVTTARGLVEVAAAPEQVIGLDIGLLDTLVALGVTPVGVPTPLRAEQLNGLSGVTKVGSLFEPDFEQIYALKPDLILAGGRSASQVEALSKIAPTIDLSIPGDDLIEGIITQTTDLGALFQQEAMAKTLTENLGDSLHRVSELASTQGTALIVMTNGPKVSAYGPGSRFGWIHNDLGFEPAVANVDTETHGEPISFEFIHDANPDWLIVLDRIAAIGQEGDSAQTTLDNPLVADTTAWKEGQVIYLNGTNVYIASTGVQSMQSTLDQFEKVLSE